LDKEEIKNIAKSIGTYEISIKPQEDCCTLFAPRRQVTAAKLEVVKEIERELPIRKLIDLALKKLEKIVVERS